LDNKPSFDVQVLTLNLIGSVLLGFGIGLFRRIADESKDRSGFGLVIVFTIFCSVTFLLFSPLFEYRAMAK